MCIHVDLAFGEQQQLNFFEMLLDDLFRAGCAFERRKFAEIGATEQRRQRPEAPAVAVAKRRWDNPFQDKPQRVRQ